MNQYAHMSRALTTSPVMDQLARLYGEQNGTMLLQRNRYASALSHHERLFGAQAPVYAISAPGRTEIGGNHTDHHRGKVLAAAVSLDTLSVVSPRDDLTVNIHSEGYPPMTLTLDDLSQRPEEEGTTYALVRGVAARFRELGLPIGGFDAVITSTVVSGSGLSSSAAFEVLISAIFGHLFSGRLPESKLAAKIGQYAENVYFGKPSGLLDQMAAAYGGLITVDFRPDDPAVTPMQYDFAAKGYSLVVVSTGGSHADLTADYAAIPQEMRAVAAALDAPCLRAVRPEEFWQSLPRLHGQVSDRALLRAIHYFGENARVDRQVAALRADDLPAFLEAILESGRSSCMYLQNVYAKPQEQGLSLALAIAEQHLKGVGAWRVHGGGFAGTTLNFVPHDRLEAFSAAMEGVFGEGCCHPLNIRPVGAAVIDFKE